MSPSHLRIALLQVAVVPLLFSGTVISGFKETPIVATGISSPTNMAVAPDGRVFVTQQTGQLRVIQNGNLLAAPAVSLTVDAGGSAACLASRSTRIFPAMDWFISTTRCPVRRRITE